METRHDTLLSQFNKIKINKSRKTTPRPGGKGSQSAFYFERKAGMGKIIRTYQQDQREKRNKEWLNLYCAGYSLTAIADHYQVTRPTVFNALKDNELYQIARAVHSRKRKIEMKAVAERKGMTTKQAAKILDRAINDLAEKEGLNYVEAFQSLRKTKKGAAMIEGYQAVRNREIIEKRKGIKR